MTETRHLSPHARLAAGALLLVALLAGCTSVRTPIETGVIYRQTDAGPVRGFWAKVRVDDPAVEFRVTAPLSDPSAPPGAEARLQEVPDWAESVHATLAVNANFFSKSLLAAPASGGPPVYTHADPVDLVGLCVSDGRVVSPARVVNGQPDPVVLILRDHRVRIAPAGAGDLEDVVAAVAGIGASDDGRQPGSLLVTQGRNTGATARVQPKVRHPRTAAGVTADGRTLILAVVDGRQPRHSVGLTLPELADLMISLGAHDAVNLDGGGSSSFVYRDPSGRTITNRASGGHWRPVGNHLGVVLRPNARQTPQPGR